MAFSYRNPVESAINALPTNFSDQVLSSTSEILVYRVEQLNESFSYSLRKEVEEALVRKGVELAPLCFKVHSHPACKVIENHIIYRVIPLNLNKVPSIALISMREEKAKKFIKIRNFSKFGNVTAFHPMNSFIDAKDNFRYLDPSNLSTNHGEMVDRLRNECLSNGWFPKVAFVHDELHHWGPKELMHFFNTIPEIRTLVGTVVCPVELLLGEKTSKNPRIYTFEIDGSDFHFFPDGVASEGYCQSIETTTWWIKTSHLTDGCTLLRISIIYSLFAHHVITVDRGSMLQKNFFFEKPDCLLDSELSLLSSNLCGGLVERSTMSSIITYLSCLKTPNKESALAKLRQLEKRDLFPDEAYLVASISSTFIKYGVGQAIDETLYEKIMSSFFRKLPDFLQEHLNKTKHWEEIFRNFLKVIANRSVKISRSRMFVSLNPEITEAPVNTDDRTPSPYSFSRVFRSTSNLITSILSTRIYSSTTSVFCPILRVCWRKSPPPTVIITDEPLLIGWNDDITIEVVEEQNSKKDCYSSSGVIIEEAMQVNPFEESSIKYSDRKNCCVFDSLSHFLDMDASSIIDEAFNSDISGELFDAIEEDKPLSIEMIQELCFVLNCCCLVQIGSNIRKLNLRGQRRAYITLSGSHATPMEKRQFESIINSGGLLRTGEPSGATMKFPKKNNSSFKIELSRIRKLIKSMERGCTGILMEISPESVKQISSSVNQFADFAEKYVPIEADFSLNLGVPGSGKSSEIKKWLLDYPTQSCLVVSPRRALAAEWTASLKGTGHVVCTFESALCQNSTMFRGIILDEISLYPPGFVDLIVVLITMRVNGIIKGPNVNKKKLEAFLEDNNSRTVPLYALGDALQTSYYSSMDSVLLDRKHDLVKLIESAGDEIDYLWYSHRLPKGFEQVIDFQCVGSNSFEPVKLFSEISATKFIDYDAVLVASQEDKQNVTIPLVCLTFGESQGLTFKKKTLICISNDALLSSEQSLIVAMTRSELGFDIYMSTNRSLEELRVSFKKKVIGSILSKTQISRERLTNLIPKKKINKIFLSGGLEEKAMNDLFILPEIQPSYPEPEEIDEELVLSEPAWFKTHIPIIGVNPMYSEVFEKMHAKEKREFYHQFRGYSEQFPDTDKGLIEDVMGFGFRFDAIFPRHSGNDDVTFWEGVKKRLSFSNPRIERGKLEESRKISGKLVDIFFSSLPKEFKVSQMDIECGLNSFNEKRAEKTEALWKAHSERSDIDWPLNHIFLFMKSQLCTKQEKMFTTAKAGQTLACFHHSILFRFGPYLRAIEKSFLRACGESYYIHSGKNFFMLNEFILKNQNLFQGDSIESDYEAFDSSQDSVILAFEEALLKKIGLPDGFIRDYVFLKLNLGCRLGSLAIMRFTGEFCTFLFNTFANMLFTFLKYDIKHQRDRLLFAGDDMASLGALKRASKEKLKLLSHFSLKAKEEKKRIPCFCGWYLTPDGILKSPKLLWARICVMKQRGLIAGCLDNYFLESVFAYNLGEKLFSYFDDSDLEYHYVVSRFFISNSYRFSGESRNSFFGIKETFGSKCPSSKLMTLLSVLREKKLKLIQSNRLTSMEMQVSSALRSFNQLDVLNPILKLGIVRKIKWLFRTFQFLIKWNLTSLLRRVQNTHISILVQFLSASHRSSQTLGGLKEKCYYMTHPLWILLQDLSRRMKSILREGLSFSCLDPSIFSRSMTHSLVKLSELLFKLKGLTSSKIEKFLEWTLAVFIGYPILLGSFVLMKVMAVGRSKKYGVVTPSNLLKNYPMNSDMVQRNLRLMLQTWISVSENEVPFYLLDKLGRRNLFANQEKDKELFLRNLLSQPHYDLMSVYRRKKKMSSIQDAIQSAIRQALDQWLWDQYIDPNHQILGQGQPLAGAPDAKVDAVNTAQVHFKSYLFGNIALLGSSGKTQWPNIDLTLPPVTVIVDEARITKNYMLNLSTVLQALETRRASSTVECFRNATFRQVCECYAPEAYMFLKRQYNVGVCTNIYKKWPRALESAPWVAFDFCTGLKMNELTPDEKKVIDRLTKRLFRTEGQKGVYEAGQEVNVDLEG